MNNSNPLYIKLYSHFRELIQSGAMKKDTKLPSIRKCAAEWNVSKTTVEAAYLQLSAEGYVISKQGSGFFVSDLNYKDIKPIQKSVYSKKEEVHKTIYDFASYSVDSRAFNFDLWTRYVKSALRNKNRLLSYGDVRGEYDLRSAISVYVSKYRGVICSPEQIVIGAGVQTLLNILCSIHERMSPAVFTGVSFPQGMTVLRDRGCRVMEYGSLHENIEDLKKDMPSIIYTSPSHNTVWGDVIPIQTRLDLLEFARSNEALIIEDDYDSEFRYYTRPVPSLQSLDGGRNVVYMGTFSRLLLPSVRISFMVLPERLMYIYDKRCNEYNQTASKTEQIALCQYLRDGHLEGQIRKSRKLYMAKVNKLKNIIQDEFKDDAYIIPSSGGFLVLLEIRTNLSSEEISKRAMSEGIRIRAVPEDKTCKYPRILLSCSGVPEEYYKEAMKKLKQSVFK